MTQKVALIEQKGFHGYSANGRPIPKRATAPTAARQYGQWQQEIDTIDDSEYEPPRMPSSSRKYMPEGSYMQGNTRFNVKYEPPPQRPAPQPSTKPKRQPVIDDLPRQKGSIHWLVFVGVGMLIMLALWVGGNIAFNAYHTWQDDNRYGRPRTFQCDAVVGHNDSPSNPSHFIALNLNRHVEIIEFPGGDATHARIFLGLTLIGDDQDLTPITLSFKDVNNDGKPDMLIHIQDQIVVFINDNGQFRPQKPGEHISL